jgi:hypothetical protein
LKLSFGCTDIYNLAATLTLFNSTDLQIRTCDNLF